MIGPEREPLGFDEEVMQVTRPRSGENTFALTEEAVKVGDLRLVLQQGQCDNAKLHEFLGHWVYRDQTLTDLLRPGLWGGLAVFLVGLWSRSRRMRRVPVYGRKAEG